MADAAGRMRRYRSLLRIKNCWDQVPSLLQRGLPIILATLLSRPLGYVRAAIQAWLFGATAAMDAFVLAFSIPSILQVILLTGPLSSILVPMLTAYRDDRRAFNSLFNSLFTLCLTFGVIISILVAYYAAGIMELAGPGLDSTTRALATWLFRLTLPMLVMQALLSVCKGALNTLDHYGAPEYAGAVFNVVMIATTLLLVRRLGIMSLAIGASLGSAAQLLMQFPFLLRRGVRYRPCFRLDLDIRQFMRLSKGAFISAMVTPMNAFIDRRLASLLFPGAVAALNYAFLLFLLPASLCVVPLSTVLLTDLASLYHQGNINVLQQRALSALRLVLILTVPVACLGAWLATPVTSLVYEYGRFQAADTAYTAAALWAYVLGLPFYGTTHVLSRCFYATQDTMTPALVNIVALGLNIVCDLLFMRWFSHWGIALASTAVMLMSTIALYTLFMRRCRRLKTMLPGARA